MTIIEKKPFFMNDDGCLKELIESSNKIMYRSDNGILRAYKKFTNLERANKEYEMLKEMAHECIISLVGCLYSDDGVYIVTNLANYDVMSLIDYREDVSIEENYVYMIIEQMIESIVYLHSNNIVHRDIKPDNFVVFDNRPNSICVKLIDFEYSINLQFSQSSEQFGGSPGYIPPEYNNSSEEDIDFKKVDCYQLMISVMKVATAQIGVNNMTEEQLNFISLDTFKDPKNRKTVQEIQNENPFKVFQIEEEIEKQTDIGHFSQQIRLLQLKTYNKVLSE